MNEFRERYEMPNKQIDTLLYITGVSAHWKLIFPTEATPIDTSHIACRKKHKQYAGTEKYNTTFKIKLIW